MSVLITSIQNIEFSSTPDGEIEIRQQGQPVVIYRRKQVDFTALMLQFIRTKYTKAYEALCEEYQGLSSNKVNYDYTIVHRFIRCNWQEFDNKADIDHREIASFEKVHIKCPLRGECENWKIICEPQFTTDLTEREMLVMYELYCGYTIKQVAKRLHNSIFTLETHRRNVFLKVGVNTLNEFNAFARENNLFNDR